MKINKNHFQKDVNEFPTISPPLFNRMDDYLPQLHNDDYFPFTFNHTPIITLTPYEMQSITGYTINVNDGDVSMTINFSDQRTITTHDRHLMQHIVNSIDRRTIPWNPNQI